MKLQETGEGLPLLLSAREVGRQIGRSPDRVYELIAAGELPAIRIGPRGIRVPRQALLDWLERKAEETRDLTNGAGDG
ncbi:MAG: helix-turn-helix domain-containing protein [Gaiellaceae bacterium]|jgi:excisionase family DNA binding protein